MEQTGEEPVGEKPTSKYVSAEKTIVESIVTSLSTGPKTLVDLFRGNDPYPWLDFLKSLDYLLSDELVEARGEGIVMDFALTPRGRAELGASS